MIGQIFNIAKWEWFKLRKRWMPWLLLAFLLIFVQIIVWTSFFSYKDLKASGGQVVYGLAAQRGGPRPQEAAIVDCADLRSGNLPSALRTADPAVLEGLLTQCGQLVTRHQDDLRSRYADFTLPGSISHSLRSFNMFTVLMTAVLVASVVGGEYNLGTLRPALAEGIGRSKYLAGKLLLLLILAAGALLVLVGAVCITSLVVQGLQSAPDGYVSGSWGHSFTVVLRIWSSLIPYVALAGFMAILTASTASAMAIALGYYFAEQIVIAVFSTFDWFNGVPTYLVGRAISEWSGSMVLGGATAGNPGDLKVSLVLVAYTVAFMALAFRVFSRRDVGGATGG